jgi:prepilin-type N-terminal cleavage/methylation domain-containing protein
MKRCRSEQGFSLLELIISAAVMSITFLAIFGFFNELRDLNRYANNLVVVNQVMHQQLELYRNTPYNNLANGTQSVASILTPYPSLRSPRSANVVVTELEASGLKQIDLTITYTDRGGLKTFSATTYVASRGVNK